MKRVVNFVFACLFSIAATGAALAQEEKKIERYYTGIGIRVDTTFDGTMRVREVLSNSPAEKAGIQAWDRLLKIDGEDIRGKELLSEKIQQCLPGSSLRLTLEQYSDITEDFTVTPGKIDRLAWIPLDREIMAHIGASRWVELGSRVTFNLKTGKYRYQYRLYQYRSKYEKDKRFLLSYKKKSPLYIQWGLVDLAINGGYAFPSLVRVEPDKPKVFVLESDQFPVWVDTFAQGYERDQDTKYRSYGRNPDKLLTPRRAKEKHLWRDDFNFSVPGFVPASYARELSEL